MARGHLGAVLRITPWHAAPRAAHVVAVAGPGPTADEVADVVDDLGRRGVHTVVTAALAVVDQAAFRSVGFVDHQHLLLLHQPLHGHLREPLDGPRRRWVVRRTRSVRVGDHDDLLALDRQAFADTSAVWQVDHDALLDATRATDEHRWRLVRRSPTTPGPVGHALTGRTDKSGFLQRLAVHPAAEGRGVGSLLVADALRWLVRSGARHAFVNTQPDNHRARTLYERQGFTVLPDGLDVLRLELRGTP